MNRLPKLVAVFLLAVLTAVPGRAQDLARTGVLETRAELEELLAQLTATSESPAYSEALRERSRAEARIIEARLQDGDFRVGDRIYLRVTLQGREFLGDTLQVVQGPAVFIPEIGEVGLEGVLRSELSDHLEESFSRYVREPSMDRVSTFIRLTYVGAVAQQGELYVPADALIGQALNLGGVPAGADLEGVVVERGGETLWDEEAVRTARREGRTLDQMSMQAGDEILFPAQGQGLNWLRVIQIAGGIAGSIAILFQVF